MGVFRVPYPEDPEARRALFHRAIEKLTRHGSYEGTPERGTFRGSTPIGSFAGSYRALDGAGELEEAFDDVPNLALSEIRNKEAIYDSIKEFLGRGR